MNFDISQNLLHFFILASLMIQEIKLSYDNNSYFIDHFKIFLVYFLHRIFMKFEKFNL